MFAFKLPAVVLLLIAPILVRCLTWDDYVLEMREKKAKRGNDQPTHNETSAKAQSLPPKLPTDTNPGYPTMLPSDSMYRLIDFYSSLSAPEVKKCPDPTHLMPSCTECIPGLQRSPGNLSCTGLHPSSVAIRTEIVQLARVRFGASKIHPLKPFALYPYLESPDYMARQETFGPLLQERGARHIVDIGAYYNPINFFLNPGHCPESVIVVEPILQAVSAEIACAGTSGRFTHVAFLPITFKMYQTFMSILPVPDNIVCIGCDSVYGPNRRLLETSFKRPFTLFIEYPSEYYHNGAFRKMVGSGPAEKLLLNHNFSPIVDVDKYQYPPNFEKDKLSRRTMKVIEYGVIGS